MDNEKILKAIYGSDKTPLVIKDHAKICARAMILPGVKEIGLNSVVSAGSVVTKRVPDNVIVSGNPAQIITKISSI